MPAGFLRYDSKERHWSGRLDDDNSVKDEMGERQLAAQLEAPGEADVLLSVDSIRIVYARSGAASVALHS